MSGGVDSGVNGSEDGGDGGVAGRSCSAGRFGGVGVRACCVKEDGARTLVLESSGAV